MWYAVLRLDNFLSDLVQILLMQLLSVRLRPSGPLEDVEIVVMSLTEVLKYQVEATLGAWLWSYQTFKSGLWVAERNWAVPLRQLRRDVASIKGKPLNSANDWVIWNIHFIIRRFNDYCNTTVSIQLRVSGELPAEYHQHCRQRISHPVRKYV